MLIMGIILSSIFLNGKAITRSITSRSMIKATALFHKEAGIIAVLSPGKSSPLFFMLLRSCWLYKNVLQPKALYILLINLMYHEQEKGRGSKTGADAAGNLQD